METNQSGKVAAAIPDGLSQKSEQLWRKVAHRFEGNHGSLILLEKGLRAADRADLLREEIRVEGAVVRSRRSGLTRPSPLLGHIETAERIFSTALLTLKLYQSEETFHYERYCEKWERLVSGFTSAAKVGDE